MNKAEWLASRCPSSSPRSALNKAARAAAFAGASGEGSSPPSPDHLWDWMDDTQKDAVVRMVRSALESLQGESGSACVEPAKWLQSILDEDGLE